MKRFIRLKLWPVAAGTILIVAAGCGRDSVKVYHVDANDSAAPAPPPMSASGAMPMTMPDGLPAPDNSGLPSLQYTLPAGWEKKALTAMRVASLGVSQGGKQADVSVIPMGGMAGGNLANVNRWRGQVGLEPIDEAALQPLIEKVVIAGQDSDLFDLVGANPGSSDAQRIIASVLHRDGTAWFFKMTGDAALVEAQKTAFIAFLKSVSFGAPTTTASMDMSQLPPSHLPIGGMTSAQPATDVSVGDKPTWTVPVGWQEGPLTQFLVAKYVVAGDNSAQAAVNVSSLAGDGGGLEANVNRWRNQLGLPPIMEILTTGLSPGDASGAQVVDFTGTDSKAGQPARLIGVIVPHNGQTWFYKLMGDATVVAQQKDALVKFVQSAKYPDAHQ